MAFEKFHCDISKVMFLPGIVDGNNVGVIKTTCSLGFAEESYLDFI
jgi:hypothetical protein